VDPAVSLEVDGLCWDAGDRPLFQDWQGRIGPGVTLVQGDEGSGKSSLAAPAGRCAAGPGRPPLNLGGAELATQPQRYRSQVFWIEPRTDAHDQDIAAVWLDQLRNQHAAFDDTDLPALFDALGLTEHLHKPLYMWSTGSRRKLWFAGARASGAPLTLVDEPFAAIDRRSIAVMLEVLRAQAAAARRAWVLADYEAPPGVPLAADAGPCLDERRRIPG
jgi:ABC-type transport system involved in cytochrome c biogenesis ATPase subunit